MLIMTVRTDKPEAEIGLYDGRMRLAYHTWQAHRELGRTIHAEMLGLLQAHGKQWQDVEGYIGFRGPGSFTGLRIGLTVINALAASFGRPVVAADCGGDKDDGAWITHGIDRLLAGDNDVQALPEYGAEASTTAPRQ